MKNKKNLIINLILFFIWVAFAVLLTWYAIQGLKTKILTAVLCSALSIVVHYFISLFFHELGHLIFAKANKMKMGYVNFGFFSIDFEKQASRVKFFTFFGENAGESVILPHRSITKEKLCLMAFGGLLFSLIYTILGAVFAICLSNGVAFCLLGMAVVPASYLLVVNSLPIDKTSDGYLIFSNSDYAEVLVAVMNEQRQIVLGLIPSCPAIFEKSNQPLARFYYYKHLVIREKFEMAKCVLNDLSANLSHLTDDEYQIIFPEIIYKACLSGNLNDENKNLAENFFVGSASDLASVRAHANFRMATGENNWAETLIKTYERLLKSSSKYEKEYEKRLKQFYADK